MSEGAWVLLGPEVKGGRCHPRFQGIADSLQYRTLLLMPLLHFRFNSPHPAESDPLDPEGFSEYDDSKFSL